VVEVSEIKVHKADQRNLIAHLLDADALAGEHDAEIDLAAIEADASACGHGGGSVVERKSRRGGRTHMVSQVNPRSPPYVGWKDY